MLPSKVNYQFGLQRSLNDDFVSPNTEILLTELWFDNICLYLAAAPVTTDGVMSSSQQA